MQLSNQWLILSTNQDDLRTITASDQIWGNATVIEKLVSKENDVRLFSPGGVGKEYVVLKQSLFSLKDLEENTEENSVSIPSTQLLSKTHHRKHMLFLINLHCLKRNLHCLLIQVHCLTINPLSLKPPMSFSLLTLAF